MRTLFRVSGWYPTQLLTLYLWTVTEASARQDEMMHAATIPVDPAAARVFPSAQFSAACGIINIHGLGILDGDYALVDELAEEQGKPAWIGTSADTQNLLLSYHSAERVWTIGVYGLIVYRAFLPVDSDMPPAHSSRWHVFVKGSSAFEEVGNVVSITCPACTAVAVSNLPSKLAACNGSYRFRAADSKTQVFTWSHTNDERCAMFHDKAGRCIVTMTNSALLQYGATADDVFLSLQGWAELVDEAYTPLSLDEEANVVCTSAGQTTRLVFDLLKSKVSVAPPQGNDAADDVDSSTPSSKKIELKSSQDGAIISSAQSNVHIRVFLQKESTRRQDGGHHRVSSLQPGDVDARANSVRVKIMVDGVEVVTTSLKVISIEGILVSLRGLEGTNVLEICLLKNQVDGATESQRAEQEDNCHAKSVLILEVFSEETQVVYRRAVSETVPPSNTMTRGTDADAESLGVTKVAFVVDIQVVDGYKLSTLHLMKHLPHNFRASALDLSCASGDLPVKEIFDKEGAEIFRVCIELPNETWNTARRESGNMPAFLYAVLVNKKTWADVTSAHPDVAGALGDLYDHLIKFDALVMSNGGKDVDAYLLQLARLAGVSTRMVNLGAITGGYMSPLFSGATSLVGPSHYVAHNPAVNQNARGLSVKVCHPVMDAARVLEAARSCRTIARGSHQATGLKPADIDASGHSEASTGGADEHSSPAIFIAVGQFAAYKTPGMFVRAVAVLNRRHLGRQQQRRRVEGVMVGTGPLRGHMENLARNLSASVRFTGFLPVDTVPCEVQRATALVLPSISPETFGMVGPEAMLLGVPLVTFGFGGTGELVRHMENGIVVAEPTPRALADACELLAEDTGLRDRLGEQARLDARRALSLPEMVACHSDELT